MHSAMGLFYTVIPNCPSRHLQDLFQLNWNWGEKSVRVGKERKRENRKYWEKSAKE